MEYEINGWEGYYLSILDEEIKVFSSWGFPIDGNKLNNQPSNLQWITRGNNVRKAQKMGRWGTSPKSYEITFLDQKKLIVTNISKFARENGYAATKLVAVSKGKRKTHKDIIKVIEL